MAGLWWCRTCGMVWTADLRPICKHNVPDGSPAREMDPLPTYHPMHPMAEEPDDA